MSKLIQWPRAQYWDKPWNPIVGCRPCSPACENCYAASMREALDAALRFIGNLEIEPYLPLDEEASELRQKIIDALYAPARNSERYCILASWLLAPAERKGEGDGR